MRTQMEKKGSMEILDIPNEWNLLRIKDVIEKIGSGVTPKGGSEVYVDKGITFLRSQNVYDDGLRIDEVSFITEATHKKMKNSQLRPYDILINITGASIGRTCIVPPSIEQANINQHILYLRVKKRKVDFISYYLKSQFIKDYIMSVQSGTSKEGLSMGQMLKIPLPLPKRTEQTQIADYLDEKIGAIDKKISLLESKVEKYRKLRKSLVNETITRGLNPNVNFKTCGIEWMKKIPEHWDVKRIKELGEISTSSVNKKTEKDERLVKIVNYTDVYENPNRELFNNKEYMIVSAKENQIQQKKLKKGDVLFTPSSETIEDIGVSSVVMEDLTNTLYSYHILRLRFSKKLDNSYKKYMLNNDFVQSYFSRESKGTTRKILGLNAFYNLLVVVPPTLNEQKEIADYLDKKTQHIDAIVNSIDKQITKLAELRKTLINDVVTGKIKVTV